MVSKHSLACQENVADAGILLLRQVNMLKVVMPDLIRHPVLPWIPAFAGMAGLVFIVAGVITIERAAAAVLRKNKKRG
jgi:hypothetical protein